MKMKLEREPLVARYRIGDEVLYEHGSQKEADHVIFGEIMSIIFQQYLPHATYEVLLTNGVVRLLHEPDLWLDGHSHNSENNGDCPICGADNKVSREVEGGSIYQCVNGHVYPSGQGITWVTPEYNEGGREMNEKEHDDHVAPLLLEAAKKAESLGGTVLCYSEYDTNDTSKHNSCDTVMMINPTAHAKLIHMAMQCRGNLDALMLGLIKAHKEGKMDLSATMFLKIFNKGM